MNIPDTDGRPVLPPGPDEAAVRLGQVLVGLRAGAKAIREGVRQHGPETALRQPLDNEEHDGYWLTRRQVYDAVGAAATIEAILRELEVRMDPRCKGKLGERPSWMSPDQYDVCRCWLPRGHAGDHECEHTDRAEHD